MKTKISIIGLISLFLVSCAASYLKDSIVVNKTKTDFDKILVVAKTSDKTSRLKFENQVVNDLAASGINATTSSSLIKTESFENELTPDQIEVLKVELLSKGYDGVILTNLINKQQYTDVNQGSMSTAFVPVRYGRFGRYYRTYPVNYWEQDEVSVGTEFTLESCFYDISSKSDDNLQWVGRFKVKDPNSLVKAIEKYSKELTSELLKKSISN